MSLGQTHMTAADFLPFFGQFADKRLAKFRRVWDGLIIADMSAVSGQARNGSETMLDIFDILGPVMVGPSSSHTAGAVRIGNMARALLGGQPVKADIALHGSFAETGQGHGTDKALVAGLLGMRPDDLDIPRSFEIAEERGLEFYIHPVQLRDAHPNTAVLTVEDADGKKMTVQGVSIGGGRIRVDKINGVDVNFTGAYNTLVVHHQDVAGELSRITNELAVGGVNIANMSLCRSRKGGDVLTIIEMDQKLDPSMVKRIRSLYAVHDVTYYEKEDA